MHANPLILLGTAVALLALIERRVHASAQATAVAERQGSARALHASEARHRLLFDSNPAPMWVHDEATLAFLAVNDAARAQYGYDASAFGSMTALDLWPDEDRVGAAAALAGGSADGRAISCRHRKHDGTLCDVEMTAHGIVFDGRPGRLTLIADVTDHRRAEAALRQSQTQLRRLLASSTAVIYSLRPHGEFPATFVSDNVLALTGFPSECFLASTDFWGSRLHPDERQAIHAAFSSVLATGQHAAEYRFMHQDGGYRWMHDEIRVVIDDSTGAPLELVGCWVDVTQRRQMEHQLAQAHHLETIGQLATGIAHEINNTVQYVGDNIRFLDDGFTSMIHLVSELQTIAAGAAGVPAGESRLAGERVDVEYLTLEIPRALGQSLEGLARVTDIVRTVKQFSHTGGGDRATVDLNHEVESAVAVSRGEWKYVAAVESDLDATLPPIRANLAEIQQVLLNLIVNASHAVADAHHDGGEQGRIILATRRRGEWAELRISDTGTGIPTAIGARIFDPFFTTKEVGRGTGQGLTVVRAIVVERHQGSIEFESEVGRGTTFTVRLPLCAPTLAAA